MHSKFDIVLDKVDDICEKFELEGLHQHPTYKQFKRLFAELKAAAPAEDVRAMVDEPVAIVSGSQVQWLPSAQGLENRTPLYRHAQRKVLMPDRRTEDSYGWNACLDEFERLNGGQS